MIILYTIDCINCSRLENKLRENNIRYEVCRDREKMRNLGMSHMPVLQTDENTCLNFKGAMAWIKRQKEAM